jgi:hypothetical protein
MNDLKKNFFLNIQGGRKILKGGRMPPSAPPKKTLHTYLPSNPRGCFSLLRHPSTSSVALEKRKNIRGSQIYHTPVRENIFRPPSHEVAYLEVMDAKANSKETLML